MVQLKEDERLKYVPVSWFQFLMVQLKAHKRVKNNIFFLFQFLMVQLKELVSYLFCFWLLVSIPYGTIKT